MNVSLTWLLLLQTQTLRRLKGQATSSIFPLICGKKVAIHSYLLLVLKINVIIKPSHTFMLYVTVAITGSLVSIRHKMEGLEESSGPKTSTQLPWKRETS